MRGLIHVLLLVLGGAGIALGLYVFQLTAHEEMGAIHEIEALICILIGTVGLGCAAIVSALEEGLERDAEPRARPAQPPPIPRS